MPLPGGGALELGGRTLVMGVLNVTPDSFSDGGRWLDPDRATAQAESLIAAGADLLDVGGESTRPGAVPVPEDEEIRRVVPVIERLVSRGLVGVPAAGGASGASAAGAGGVHRAGAVERNDGGKPGAARLCVPVSVDTYKAGTARAALAAGAAIVNDIRGLTDPGLVRAAAEAGAAVVAMHCPVAPAVMASHTSYADLFAEVCGFLQGSLERASAAGIPAGRVILDPGIGFAKTAGQSAELIDRCGEMCERLDRPVLVGPSRKSFIGRVLDRPADRRAWGTAAAVAWCVARGAHIVRVHDVAEMAEVCRVADFLAHAAER